MHGLNGISRTNPTEEVQQKLTVLTHCCEEEPAAGDEAHFFGHWKHGDDTEYNRADSINTRLLNPHIRQDTQQ
jgi:hypothetical protein